MHSPADILRGLPMDSFDSPHADSAWEHCALASASNRDLLDAVAKAIAKPKLELPSSFSLHAPLELAARATLLPRVRKEARSTARRQIAAIACRYAHAGAEIDLPEQHFANVSDAQARLLDALHTGLPDDANASLGFLLQHMPLAALRMHVVDDIAPMLGAAGHAPILLAALPRMASSFTDAGELLHAPVRSLARAASSRLSWHLAMPTPTPQQEDAAWAEEALWMALANAPKTVSPSVAIAPTMLTVQDQGLAADLLQGPCQALSLAQVRRVVLRVAAMSMLQDTPSKAQFGWTHCLTLPQALLANADASHNTQALCAIAATHSLGFRSTLGTVALDPTFTPTATSAAGQVYFADATQRDAIAQALVTKASCHPDAHFVKYTLACLEAANSDPAAAPLYIAAAAHLAEWFDVNAAEEDHRK
jgi:hypothetical protein